MTMTDLGNFGFKRSPFVKEYRYVFHAAVSIHQQYAERAFFNYDTFYALHRQHTEELLALEKFYGLPYKNIIPYGYPLLDRIQQTTASTDSEKTILVAPSWFDGCIFDVCIDELMIQLSVLAYAVVLRPHPEYVKRHAKKYQALKKRYQDQPRISFDEGTSFADTLSRASVLITDRSGIALEYAFGAFRPVLFIDTLPKIMNVNYKNIGIEPLEDKLRPVIGVTVSPENLPAIQRQIEWLETEAGVYKLTLQQLKSALFY